MMEPVKSHPEKKPYKTPDLIEHGTVETITGMPTGDEDLSPIVDD